MLDKTPMFEPNEEAKLMIEAMFSKLQQEKKQDKEESNQVAPTGTRQRVKIPEAPAQTEEEYLVSVELAQQELDLIHDAFLDFSDLTNHTVMYGYLYNEIVKLTEAFQDMEYMVTDEANKDKITQSGLPDYEKMRKIRAHILSDVYKKYKKDK